MSSQKKTLRCYGKPSTRRSSEGAMKMGKLTAIAAILLVAAGLVVGWLFRREEFDVPGVGLQTLRYRWGRPMILYVDSNRDGVRDAKAILDAPFGGYASHLTQVTEYWESTQLDGRFDRHVYVEKGEVVRIEVDVNQDGRIEKVIEGEAAREVVRLGRDPS